jgi:DMSO reductase family type II enzyme chaperone
MAHTGKAGGPSFSSFPTLQPARQWRLPCGMAARKTATEESTFQYGRCCSEEFMPVASQSPPPARLDWASLDLYRFFAFVFSSPSPERFDTLAQPALKESLPDLWLRLHCTADFPHFVWFKNYDDYEATYIALFDVGIPEPPVPLFESAHDKTRPAQEIALENTWFYDALGLRWDSRCAVPDYLITQLEFLAAVHYSLENAQDIDASQSLAHLEADFLDRHMLNWVPTAAARLDSVSRSAFGLFLTLLVAYLHNRRDEGNDGALAVSLAQRYPQP